VGRSGGDHIASNPRKSNIRETSAKIVGDEDVCLRQRKHRCLKIGITIVPLSGHRGRVLWCEDIEDRARRPLAVTGLSQEAYKTERVTCQFQGIGLQVSPQEVDDCPVFHQRRHHGIFFIIHHDPN